MRGFVRGAKREKLDVAVSVRYVLDKVLRSSIWSFRKDHTSEGAGLQ